MKRILLLLAIVFFCAFDQEQNTMPALDLTKLNGGHFNTSELDNDGKPILVLVWELSCKPCLQEFDNITKLYDQWKQQTGVKVVAISVDDNRNYTKVAQQVRSKGWPFEFYQDKNQDIRRAMGVQLCPYAFILNANKVVVWRKTGYAPGDEHAMFELIQKVSKGETISEN